MEREKTLMGEEIAMQVVAGLLSPDRGRPIGLRSLERVWGSLSRNTTAETGNHGRHAVSFGR